MASATSRTPAPLRAGNWSAGIIKQQIYREHLGRRISLAGRPLPLAGGQRNPLSPGGSDFGCSPLPFATRTIRSSVQRRDPQFDACLLDLPAAGGHRCAATYYGRIPLHALYKAFFAATALKVHRVRWPHRLSVAANAQQPLASAFSSRIILAADTYVCVL